MHTPLANALGWTLFHSLWEGTAVALVLLGIFCVIRSAQARYVSACVALAVIAMGFVVTFFLLRPEGLAGAATAIDALPGAPLAGDGWMTAISERLRAEDVLPWLAPFWLAGVMLFQLRSVVSWIATRRIRTRGVCRAPDRWQQRLLDLASQIRLSKPVALLESCLTDIPVVSGNLRPAILVPIGFLSGMPECQIEAILLHELAHVVRRDYLVNLIQTVVEGFLFYHPAVWWISSAIRAERENCCDDMVVAAGSDASEYAAALTILEENRQPLQKTVLAATGGSLMKRIRRLLRTSESPRKLSLLGAPGPVLSTGVVMITAALAFMAWPVMSPPAHAQTNQAVTQDRWQKWLSEDVPYIITDPERNAFRHSRRTTSAPSLSSNSGSGAIPRRQRPGMNSETTTIGASVSPTAALPRNRACRDGGPIAGASTLPSGRRMRSIRIPPQTAVKRRRTKPGSIALSKASELTYGWTLSTRRAMVNFR